MKLEQEYVVIFILTILLILMLVIQSCQQSDVKDSYGIMIKANGPARAYSLQPALSERRK